MPQSPAAGPTQPSQGGNIGRAGAVGYTVFHPMKRRKRSKPGENTWAASPGKSAASGNERSALLPTRFAGASSRWSIMLAAGLLVPAAVAVFSNSFAGPFVFDGEGFIEQNPAIRALWPPSAPMLDTNRPVGLWSFALNYAVGGLNVWGYHAANLVIHLAAALVLFAVVRRTLSRGRLAARFGPAAFGLALAVALLWLVHPLQTQSVTYIYQRYESLMGLWFLLTLYCFIRGAEGDCPFSLTRKSGPSPRCCGTSARWLAACWPWRLRKWLRWRRCWSSGTTGRLWLLRGVRSFAAAGHCMPGWPARGPFWRRSCSARRGNIPRGACWWSKT